jgi:hypothetical protein
MRFNRLVLLLLPVFAYATPGFHEPWGKDTDLSYSPPQMVQEAPRHSFSVRVAEQIILFHQNVLSPVDGPRSHFRPSSSSYMLLSMQKHGFIEGFLMGCDRLMRENSDDWVYRKIVENGQLIKYDPPR